MAQKLRKDLADGETERLSDYNSIMKGIHLAIKGIRKEVKDIQKSTSGMLGNFAQDREGASAAWNKMQSTIAQLRKTGTVIPAKEAVKKVEKKEVIIETSVDAQKAAPVEAIKETPVIIEPKTEPKPEMVLSLEDKVLNFINKHPKGVKVSEMEEPLGETRMKLGFASKNLLDEGKVQKIDNFYFPNK